MSARKNVPFGPAATIFRVTDVRASVDYYVNALGFTIDWDEGDFVSVTRGRCTLFLTDADQTRAQTWIWTGVADVVKVHDEVRASGARVRHPPTNHPWALEMQIEDLDGNVLRVGSEPRDGERYGGFLDASGTLWDPPAAKDAEAR